MLFFNIFTLVFAACLAMAAPLGPIQEDQKVIIGYRTVSATQAADYNQAGTLVFTGNRGPIQLGEGVYTTPKPGGWAGPDDAWHCVILADSSALDRVSKAWVPDIYHGTKLWYDNDAIDQYIVRGLDNTWNPHKTLRLALIAGMGYDDLQLLIPPKLLNQNGGGMGFVASCKKTLAELPTQVVNYDDWQNNIRGDRYIQNPGLWLGHNDSSVQPQAREIN